MTAFIVRIASLSGSMKMPTKRSTPIPENTSDAGDHTYEIGDKGVEEERLA